MQACFLTLMMLLAVPAWAGPAAVADPARPPSRTVLQSPGSAWNSLDPALRRSLAPLERDWAQMSPDHQQKWVEMAQRLPSMSVDKQQRIRSRMAEWARMSPAERGQARLHFLQAQRTGTEDRGKRWGDYQALPNDQKKQFAARAAGPAASAERKPRPADAKQADRGNDGPATKSNLVTNPNFSAQPRPVAPMTLKAGPGASTTLVTKPPAPPPHQQTGLPKIAASPTFVDKSTLLPKRGPQGAATAQIGGGASAADPVARP